MKKYLSVVLFLALIGCSSTIPKSAVLPTPHRDVYYRFEKAPIIPNRYYLKIINKSNRAILFNPGDAANFITLSNGKTLAIVGRSVTSTSRIDTGFVLRRAQEGTLQFDIPDSEMRQAVSITFKGASMVNRMTSLDYWVTDRELIVTYDIATAEFSVEDGEKIKD